MGRLEVNLLGLGCLAARLFVMVSKRFATFVGTNGLRTRARKASLRSLLRPPSSGWDVSLDCPDIDAYKRRLGKL